ncbi:hypothetical protein D5770_23715 [Salmonella enterica subsp. enterica]|nr:hypothetical protein [Salmonella enterica subsp. enterica]ECJ4937486.1 hypothetical protein [Salmonella enterica subsp. enterica]
MLSKTGFTHSDLLCWQIDYAGGSLNVNGTIMRDTYNPSKLAPKAHNISEPLIPKPNWNQPMTEWHGSSF